MMLEMVFSVELLTSGSFYFNMLYVKHKTIRVQTTSGFNESTAGYEQTICIIIQS